MASAHQTDPANAPAPVGASVWVFVLLAAALAIGTYALILHRENALLTNKISALLRQQTTSDIQRQNAIEQRAAAERERLIAERKRQNAVEERALAERERLNAENQRLQAIKQRAAAEREKANAENRRQEAIEQRALAERERLNAENQRLQAIEQRTVAEKLRLLALARSIAVESLKMQQGGDGQRAALLAIQAYLFNARNGGSAQNPDIYSALRQATFALQTETKRILVRHDDDVRAIAFHPQQETVFSAGDDGTVRLASLQETGVEKVWGQSNDRVQALAISQDGNYLAAGDSDGLLWFWRQGEKKSTLTKKRTTSAITSLAFSNGGNTLAAGHLNGTISLWSLPTLDLRESAPLFPGNEAHTMPIAFPGFALLWAIGNDLQYWDIGSPTPRAIGKSSAAISAITAPTSRLFAAATTTGEILVWDLERSDKPAAFIGHASQVTSLSFSPDRRQLASGSLDNTIKIWNVDALEDEPISIDHGAWVWAVAFSPLGNELASAGADRSVRLWPAHSSQMAAALCLQLETGLTPEEWQKYIGADIDYEKTCASLTLINTKPTTWQTHEME